MAKEILYKLTELTMPAKSFVPVEAFASHFYLKSVSAAGLQISIDSSDYTEISSGIHIEMRNGDTFRRIKLYNSSDAALTVKIALSSEIITDSSLVFGETIYTEDLTLHGIILGDEAAEAWGDEKTVGTAAASVIASNANRKGFSVQAKESNTDIIYIGWTSSTSSTRWVAELQPGMSFSLTNYRGDIYAIATAAGQKLGWGEW